jgi:hypothetical protein
MSNCAVYEDIYFQKNGEIKYSLSIDASEILKASPSSSDIEFSASTDMLQFSGKNINIAQMMKDSLKGLELTDDILKDLENIKPLFMKFENDPKKKKLNISVFGDLKNAEAFNNAFISMNRIEEIMKQQKEEEEGTGNNYAMSEFYTQSFLSWDKSVMRRTINNDIEEEEEDNEESEDIEEEDSVDNIMNPANMFSQFMNNDPFAGLLENITITTRYHFQKKIDKVNDPEAVISKDGKTATIEYSGKPDKQSLIEISVK